MNTARVRTNLRSSKAKAKGQRGMTLVEIMIVVVIMGLIASAVGIAVNNQAKRARIEDAKQGVRTIEHAAQLWQQDHPSGCPTVQQLVADGVINSHTRQKDPWEQEYSITCESGDVTVRSNGPDQRAGSDDDIPQQQQNR